MSVKHIVVDFEMNPLSADNLAQFRNFHREIIEIGAVVVDGDTGTIVDRFRCFVRPQFNAKIEGRITKMTGIRTNDTWDAPVFADALARFSEWIGDDPDVKLYSWSNSDPDQIRRECAAKGIEIPANMRQWIDFQAEYTSVMSFGTEKNRLSLPNAAVKYGIEMDEDNSHSALYDAEITAKLLIYVLSGDYERQRECLKECVGAAEHHCSRSLGNAFKGLLGRFSEDDTNVSSVA